MPDTVFFTDRDLGKQFPAILAAAGIQVDRHADHFADDAIDEEWIAAVASRGWIAVSHDRRISRRPNERDAVFEAGLGLLLVVGKAPYPELARNFVVTIRRIEAFLDRHQPPFIARVYQPTPAELKKLKPVGRVELWQGGT